MRKIYVGLGLDAAPIHGRARLGAQIAHLHTDSALPVHNINVKLKVAPARGNARHEDEAI